MSNNTWLAASSNHAGSAGVPTLGCAFGIGTGVSSPKGADFGPAPMRRPMDVYVTANPATGPSAWSPPIT